MSVYDSPLNSNFKQNQFSSSSSDKKSGPALSQSADRTIQRIQGFQSKITETNSAKVSIVDKQKALGRIEAKVLKAKEFLNDVNENLNQLVAQKEKLSSELEGLTEQNDFNLILAKEKELQSLIEQIQGLETVRNAPDHKGASTMVSNALERVRASLNELQNIIEAVSKLSEKFPNICEELSEDQIQQLYLEFPRDVEMVMQALARFPQGERGELVGFTFKLRAERKYAYDLILIIKALVEIPQVDRAELVEVVSKLRTQKMNVRDLILIIETLNKIPLDERAEIIECREKLGNEEISADDLILIIKALVEIPQVDRAELVEVVSKLRIEKSANNLIPILQALAKVPQGERVEFADCVAKLVTQKMREFQVQYLTEAIANIPQVDRAKLVEVVSNLRIEKNVNNLIPIIKALTKIPKEERVEFADCVAKLVTQKMDTFEVGDLTEALVNIPQGERAELVQFASKLVTVKMDKDGVKGVIEALAKISQGERAELVQVASKLMTGMMDQDGVKGVIEALAKIPQDERVEFANCVEKLVKNRSGVRGIIEVLAQIPQRERAELVKCIAKIVTMDISVVEVISTLAKVPQEERAEIVECIVKLLETVKMDGNRTGEYWLLQNLIRVPQGERAELTECTAKLGKISRLNLIRFMSFLVSIPKIERADMVEFIENMSGVDPDALFDDLTDITQGKRVELVKVAAKLGTKNWSRSDQKMVMQSLPKIPLGEGAEIAEYTVKLSTKSGGVSDQIKVIEALAKIPRNERGELVESVMKLKTEWISDKSILDLIRIFGAYIQINSSNQKSLDKLASLLKDFQSICDKEETIEKKQEKFDDGLRWLCDLMDDRAEKIIAEKMNFFLDKGFLKAIINYNDASERSRLSLYMVESEKHPEIFKNIWDEKLPAQTKIPMLLIGALQAQGLEAKAIKELLVTARNNSFKDGKNLKVFVDAILALIDDKELSSQDKEFILSKIKLPPKSEKPAVKATFSFLHAIIAFKVMNRFSLLSKDQLEKSSIKDILQKTIKDLIPMDAIPNFEELYEKYFETDRVPNFLLTYAAKLESLMTEKDMMLKFLGVIVESIFKEDLPSVRYDMKGKHLNTVFSERADLLEEWEKGDKVSLGDYFLQTDEKVKPANFRALLKDKIITHEHINKELVPQLYAFLDEGTPQEINGTDPLSIIQKNCIELTNEKLSLGQQKNLLKEINKALGEVKEGEEFKHDISGFLSGLIKQDEVVTSYNKFTIEDTDNYMDLFLAGQEVANSCQRVDGDPNLNKCLLGYVADGKNRLLAIKDKEGKIVARQIFRILWDGEKPVLLTEPIYPDLVKSTYSKALELFAKQRAKELGLPLLAVTEDNSLPTYGKAIYSLGSPAPYEYSDTADRRELGPGVTEGIYTISQAKIIQG